jgi:trehalose 6-phosphate phosphatase
VASFDEVQRALAPLDRAAIVVDADGTLVPIAPRPELARVHPPAAAALEALVGRAGLVAVVSGRPSTEVALLVGVEGPTYVGVYGLEDAAPLSPAVLRRLRGIVAAVPGAWVEPKGAAVSVHVRAAEDPVAAEATLAPLLETVAAAEGLEMLRGKYTLELAPAGQRRKGAAVERLIAASDVDAVLFAGDDRPDLEAFEALDAMRAGGRSVVKVAVAGAETPSELEAAADVVVEGPAGLASLLSAL